MLQSEIEQKAKEKVLTKIEKLPQFTHKFFTENETISFTTKRGYLGILYHFLYYVKDLFAIDDVVNISAQTLEELELQNIKQYENILSNEFSESTVKSRLNSLKGVFKFLYYNQIISKNVMSQVIVDNKKESAKTINENALLPLFVEVSHISNDFLRKRNLCILSIIIDTGLSIQDIVELNISNVVGNQIIIENTNGTIQYVLNLDTIKYLKDYIDIIDTTDANRPLFNSTMSERMSVDVIKNIFKRYGTDLLPSHFQAKPKVTIKDSHNYTLIIERKKNIKPSIKEVFSMELLLVPFFHKDSYIIDTKLSFNEDSDYEINVHKYYFKSGFTLYSTDDNYNKDKKVASVEGIFFKYNHIQDNNIDIIDLADTISDDVVNAINILENNELLSDINTEKLPLVCYLNRLYIYPKFRDKGIATYIYENLQKLFEYVTGDLASIFITFPRPQEPVSNTTWHNVEDENGIMLDKMIKLLDKHDFKPIGNEGFYYKSYT